ncbi:SCO6880 family protein [Nocardia sp. NPDC058499]|uniref:SCO6880 family protein n=1 Tax=Nocardia sp. NPDC058499 TaxID=3346530 RepID=UPI00366822F5
MGSQKYAGWRKPESTGMIPGLSSGMSMAAVGAMAMAIGSAYLMNSMTGAIVILVVAALLIGPSMIRFRGTSAGDYFIAWLRSLPIRRQMAHRYRTGLYAHVPGGRSRLPGLAAPIILDRLFDPITGDDIGALVNLVHRTVTIVMNISVTGRDTQPESTTDAQVAGWGEFVRRAGAFGDVAGIAVVTDTVPETGARYNVEIDKRRHEAAPDLVLDVMDDRTGNLATDRIRYVQRISVTFRYSGGNFRSGIESLARRLEALTDAAAGAGLFASFATVGEIIASTHAAFNPAAGPILDEAMALNDGDPGITWNDAGPTYHDDEYSYYLHDSGKSFTFRAWDYPVQPIEDDVLDELLASTYRAPYKRVTMIYRPYRPHDAKEITDSDYRDAFAAVQRRKRGVVDANQRMRYDDIEAARDDLAEGHGLTRVGVLVTVTVPIGASGMDETSFIRAAGVASSIKFAPCYSDQAAMFLAALGIGVYPDMDETDVTDILSD